MIVLGEPRDKVGVYALILIDPVASSSHCGSHLALVFQTLLATPFVFSTSQLSVIEFITGVVVDSWETCLQFHHPCQHIW